MEIASRLRGASFAAILAVGLFFVTAQGGASLLKESDWQQGKAFLAEGKAREARDLLEKLLQRYSEEPDLHLLLGIAALRLREIQAAEIHINRVLGLEPDHAEARTLLGWIHLEIKKDYPAAVREYTRVVALRPGSAEAYNNLGVALKKQGELDRAIASLSRAVELRGNYGEALSNRGWVFLEQKKYREARADFEASLTINPKDEGALYGLTQVLRAERDYSGAEKVLSRVISQSPNFVYWLEWVQLKLVHYYWILLMVAAALFLHARYNKARTLRRESHGG
ncbi:MAG: tetratricopeptide repeat protein [Deltaproteobacteria bacterium]|nr:tetratricopeptide repeat protein [Deltaproteobacteria bacterium]